LSWTVKGERGETTGEEALLVVVHFLLRRVEPHAHHDDRSSRGTRGPEQVAVEVLPFVGNGHPLAWRHEMRQRPVAAFNRLHVRLLHLRKVDHEEELAEVVA